MKEKVKAIISVQFLELVGLELDLWDFHPLVKIIRQGNSVILPVTDAELKEKEQHVNGFWNVSFSAKITDCSATMTAKIESVTDKIGVLLLNYSNGDTKMVGTTDAPIRLQCNKAGKYEANTLVLNSLQPDKARFVRP